MAIWRKNFKELLKHVEEKYGVKQFTVLTNNVEENIKNLANQNLFSPKQYK